MKKRRIYDPSLTLKISNKTVIYDLSNDYLIFGSSGTNKWRKNGYLTYDSNGEELGVVFADDDRRHKSFGCLYLLFFKKYTVKHRVGVWRVIKPVDYVCATTEYGYIEFETLEKKLSEKSYFEVTTQATYHNE